MTQYAALALFAVVAGCHQSSDKPGPTVDLVTGVTFTRDTNAGVQILDVDLLSAHVRGKVVAENVVHHAGVSIGDCKTARDWADEYHAVGGMNGGYFGQVFDQVGLRKQLIGLAATDGVIVAPSAGVSPQHHPDLHLIRSAIGFSADGTPDIAWATGTVDTGLIRYSAPANPPRSAVWRVSSAVMCGPRLFFKGQRDITDHEEWLVSAGKLPRAFVAYDWELGRPRHLVLGRADSMEYAEIADFLTDYFARVHHSSPHEAMCLDGGPSAQIAYREGENLQDAVSTGVLVPTAIVLVPSSGSAVTTPSAVDGVPAPIGRP